MINGIRHSTLSVLLTAGLVVYHLCNFLNHRWLALPSEVHTKPISLIIGNARLMVKTPTIEEDLHRVDFSSLWLGDYGYSLRYRLGQIPKRVLIGKEGRFYARKNLFFQLPESQRLIHPGFQKGLQQVERMIKKAGGELVLLPIPTKMSLERSLIPRALPGDDPFVRQRIRNPLVKEDPTSLYQSVSNNVETTIDLTAIFESDCNGTTPCPHFVPHDHHWSSLGVATSARAILARMTEERVKLQRTGTLSPTPYHFLLKQFLLPRRFVLSQPEFQWHEPIYETTHVSKVRFKRVVILGTSYSHRLKKQGASLGQLLAKSLNVPLLDLSRDAAGTTGSLIDFHTRGFRFREKDLVVWEFPINEATDWNTRAIRPGTSIALVRFLDRDQRSPD